MKFYDVTYWMPVHYCVIASSEEEAFKKAEALPFIQCDPSTWDDHYMSERGVAEDFDQLVADDLNDAYSEFYIDDRAVTEQEFREFGNKHLVSYQLSMPKNEEADGFAVHIRTKNICKEERDGKSD